MTAAHQGHGGQLDLRALADDDALYVFDEPLGGFSWLQWSASG
jgi:hypothetical protein